MKTVSGRCMCLCWLIGFLFCAGCMGPRYAKHQLVIFGKRAPAISNAQDPAIAANLRSKPGPKISMLAQVTDVGVAPFKDIGIQGWTDYHLHASAYGKVVQHRSSSSGFITVDMRLASLTVNGVPVRLAGPRFIRLEIFRGHVPVDETIFDSDPLIYAGGKLVWDNDGWFEIHPQKDGDVALFQTVLRRKNDWIPTADNGSRAADR